MLKKTMTFKDFNGESITEDFYFHLSEAEIVELELVADGNSFSDYLRNIADTKDAGKIINEFKKMILMSYGQKSPDGRRFVKNDQLREEFMQTNAFSQLFMELATDSTAGAKFLAAIVPEDLQEKVDAIAADQEKLAVAPQTASGSDVDMANVDDRPAWEREDRNPTQKELQGMTKEQMQAVMLKKMSGPSSA